MFATILIIVLTIYALYITAYTYLEGRRSFYLDVSNENLRATVATMSKNFADRDRQLNSLRDEVKDTIRILAKQRPIDFEVYKLLTAECQCAYCRELFADYLDMSEGSATDVAPLIAAGVVAAPEEATARGNTVEVPTPVLLVNPE